MDNVEKIEDIKESILNRIDYIINNHPTTVDVSMIVKNLAEAYVVLSELGGGEL